jgi:hypothetical protein
MRDRSDDLNAGSCTLEDSALDLTGLLGFLQKEQAAGALIPSLHLQEQRWALKMRTSQELPRYSSMICYNLC